MYSSGNRSIQVNSVIVDLRLMNLHGISSDFSRKNVVRSTHPSSDSISCLEDGHSGSILDENVGASETRKPSPYDCHVGTNATHCAKHFKKEQNSVVIEQKISLNKRLYR